LGFQFEVKTEASGLAIVLKGAMDEEAVFPNTVHQRQEKIIIDLENVTLINSMGARAWVNWVRSLESLASCIVLEKCPPIVVNQINILLGFLPKNGVVGSFKIPYFCEDCGLEEAILWQMGVQYQENGAFQEPEDKACPKCQSAFAADCVPQFYFRFLTRKRV